ncbi:MAG TPA: thymidylate kinase [Terriglobales bacterium]
MYHGQVRRLQPMLVSFSGLDGSGKTTQIAHAREVLVHRGRRVTILAFWDDAVVGKRYREEFVHRVYGSEKGVGSPEHPVERQDKNVRAWYLTIARHALYLVDAVNLRRVIIRAWRHGADVVLMDRYVYDELANLPLDNRLSQVFIHFVNWLVPRPDLALLLDADPEAARARKPEYPLEFMRKCRRAYFRLSRILGNLRIVPPLPLTEARREVEMELIRTIQSGPGDQPQLDFTPAA